MEPLFKESKDRLMVKIAGLAEKGEAANALEYVRHTALLGFASVAIHFMPPLCLVQSTTLVMFSSTSDAWINVYIQMSV